MTQEKIQRINELYRKSQAEGLSEAEKKGKNLFWAMVKIIVWVTFMVLYLWFVLYEMLDIFVFKDQHVLYRDVLCLQ